MRRLSEMRSSPPLGSARPPSGPTPETSPAAAMKTKFTGLPQLETVAEAEARNQRRIDDLVDREPEIAATLEACGPAAFCCSIVCAVCSRRFRRGFIRELVRIAKSYEGAREFATIHLQTIPEGSLPGARIKPALDRLRKRLQRSGFAGSILVGGVEVAWLARDRLFVLHLHIAAFGVAREAWAALEGRLAGSGRSDPLDVAALNNPERQLSYALKFATYHRPGKIGRNDRAQAYPLPRDRLAELAVFWSRYCFGDFVFLYGARRRGGRIVIEA
jgi:hypothetical protein